jgi:hypothetical protein
MTRARITGTRRTLLGAALGLGIALAPAAGAAPSTVGQHHDDVGTAIVRGTDGLTYQVTFELEATSGNPSQAAVATVKYKACKRSGSCGFTYSYVLSLSPAQVSFPDANTASVTTKLLGQPLRLHWAAHPTTPAASISGKAEIPDTVAVGDPTSGGSADFTAAFFGTSCGGNGTVTNQYGAFAAPEAGPSTGGSRVPAGFVTKHGHKPSCQSSG